MGNFSKKLQGGLLIADTLGSFTITLCAHRLDGEGNLEREKQEETQY
jgi:hypothetical protein